MVVSGLPKPNDGRHIAEISNMALDLLDQVSRFTIRHRSKETLKLRIGIHSGPCAAGDASLHSTAYVLFFFNFPEIIFSNRLNYFYFFSF